MSDYCKSCGAPIQKGKNSYCSKDCKKSLNVTRSSLFSVIKKCLKCGKSYENKPGKFCSLHCATAYSLKMGEIN